MKKILLILLCCLSFNYFKAQVAADAAVQLSVSTQASPASITLHWTTNAASNQYQIWRKLKTAVTWGAMLAAVQGSVTQYTDNTVVAGQNYEYKVSRVATGYTGFGYINCGIEVPEVHFRGKLLLVIDSSFISVLAPELLRLQEDIEGDGWEVIRIDVDRNGSVQHVKSKIVTAYNQDVTNTKAVFLFGHIPVPYSGNLNPDGHGDHLGAWPADVYYGDVNGVWTDIMGPTTAASPARTQNLPGDGKFDQSAVPGDIELQVGRVDLANMSAFNSTGNEEQLLRLYLDKDHAYRKKIFAPQRQAVVDDNFGYFSGEAFAASAYKNFAPLLGSSNIVAADYITSLNNSSYLWSYGCGGGSFTSASGIGNTNAIAASTLQGVFSMLFGSYFGDWDVTNSFLRAPLASGSMLTNVWSGRPHYQFHHMGLGENIGYSLLATQNNPGLYFTSVYAITGKWIHNALMGDPTLRNNVVAPVSNVTATKSGYDCIISWSASTETNIVGYNLYMKNDTNNSYVKLNGSPLSSTSYTDQCLEHKGIYKYMVRALKLENTPSGSYYNMSEGLCDTALNSTDITVKAAFNSAVSGSVVNVTNTSTNALVYSWDLGNGTNSTTANATTTYSANGIYTITLVASGACSSDTVQQTINICNWPAAAAFSYYLGNDSLYLYNSSANSSASYWSFGNGQASTQPSPVTTFTAAGSYTITLVASNSCSSDTLYQIIDYSPLGLKGTVNTPAITVFPNPSSSKLFVQGDVRGEVFIYNSAGQLICNTFKEVGIKEIDVSGFPNGLYVIWFAQDGTWLQRRFCKY